MEPVPLLLGDLWVELQGLGYVVPGQVLHYSGAKGVTKHIYGSSEPIPYINKKNSYTVTLYSKLKVKKKQPPMKRKQKTRWVTSLMQAAVQGHCFNKEMK